MTSRPACGFTLIEVILAISLTLGLVGAALGFNQYVQNVKRDTLADVEALVAQQRAMELLTSELRGAFAPRVLGPDSGATPPFNGASGGLDFLTTSLPGPAAFLPPEQHPAGSPPQGDVQRVTYRIRAGETADGTATNEGVERVSLSAMPAGDGSNAPALVDLVAPSVHFLRLRYHVGDPSSSQYSGPTDNGWADTWQGDLPLAVEITMGSAPLAEGQDVNQYLSSNETFRRVVFLPASTLKPLGAAGGGQQ